MDFYYLDDIPEDFHKDGEKDVFRSCTFCSRDLGANDNYLIEKSYKKSVSGEGVVTVFEYAICQSCSEKKMEGVSEESRINIQKFFEDNLSLFAEGGEIKSFQQKMEKCAFTGRKREDIEEYNVIGQFVGDKMVVGQFPLLVSGSYGEDLQEVLSESTKKEFDDFMDTITDVPPELRVLLKSKSSVLV